MAQLPSLKRLLLEDFQDQRDWITKLITPLNEFMENSLNALTRNLTFRDNILSQIKELEVTTLTQPQSFKCTLVSKPLALLKASIVEVSANPQVITSAVDVDWEWDGSNIRIKNVTGLTAGKRYKLVVIVVGG